MGQEPRGTMTITVLAYKADSGSYTTYTRGFRQASYSSDLKIGEFASTARAAEFAAKHLGFEGDTDEDGYSIIVLVGGRACARSGFLDDSDFNEEEGVEAGIKAVWREAQAIVNARKQRAEEDKRRAERREYDRAKFGGA